MALTYDSTNDIWTDSFTVNKVSGTKLLLSTNDKYVTGDIEFTIGVSTGSATTPATTITSTPSISFANDALTATNSKTQNVTPTVSAGWVTSGTEGTITVNGSKSITALTIPVSNSFSITQTAASSANTNKKLTIINNAYRNISITNNANATTTITANTGTTTVSSNSGTVSVTSASNSAGNVTIAAYNGSTLSTYTNIVSGGKWALCSPSIVNADTGTSTATINFGKQIKIPKGVRLSDIYYTAQAPNGTVTITSQTNFDVTSYAKANVQSAVTSISGGGLSGTATAAAVNESCVIDSSTDTSGIAIKTACTPTRAIVTCSASTAGWVASGTIKELAANSNTAMTSTTYYINEVTVPASKVFTVSTSGTVSLTVGSSSAGTINVNAYNNAETPALTGSKTIIENGKWKIPSVTASGTYYGMVVVGSATVKMTGGTLTSKSASVTPTNAVLGTGTDGNLSGIVILAKGTAGRTKVTYNGAVSGFVVASSGATISGGSAISASTWNGTTYYVNEVTVPASKAFIVTTSGTTTITSGGSDAGTIKVNAYDNATTSALTGVQEIVTNGKWVTTSVSASGTFYGMVTVGAGSASADFTNTNLGTYFNDGSESDNNVIITPRWSTTAGYISTLTNQNGTPSYYKIKTASPTFSAAPSGGSTATSSQITMDTTSTTAGIEIQTKYNITSVAIKYKDAATGWISKTANTNTGSTTTKKNATNGTKYYVTAVTVPTTKSLTVTTSAGASGDTGVLTVTNNSNRTVTATNATNGIIQVTSNSGLVEVTSASASAGNVQLNAYNDASTSALTGLVSIVSGGKWVYGKVTLSGSKVATAPTVARTTTTASGATNVGSGNSTTTAPSSGYFVSVQATAPATSITPTVTLNTAGYIEKTGRITGSVSTTQKAGSVYYITVPGANPIFEGGALSGTATVGTWNNITIGSSDTSGVSIVTSGTHARAKVTYKNAVNGYVVKSAGADAYSASGDINLSTSTYYITGATLVTNSSASRTFTLTIPNGNSTAIPLLFTVDTSGNVVVT